MADRLTYVPLVGVFIAVAWGVPAIPRLGRFVAPVLGGAMYLALRYDNQRSAGDSLARAIRRCVTHALAVSSAGTASNFLGHSLVDQGRQSEATPHFADPSPDPDSPTLATTSGSPSPAKGA